MTNLLEESTRTGKFGLAVALGPPCPTGSAAVTARPVASSMCLGRVPQARRGFRSNKSRRPGEMVGTGSQYCLRLRTQKASHLTATKPTDCIYRQTFLRRISGRWFIDKKRSLDKRASIRRRPNGHWRPEPEAENFARIKELIKECLRARPSNLEFLQK